MHAHCTSNIHPCWYTYGREGELSFSKSCSAQVLLLLLTDVGAACNFLVNVKSYFLKTSDAFHLPVEVVDRLSGYTNRSFWWIYIAYLVILFLSGYISEFSFFKYYQIKFLQSVGWFLLCFPIYSWAWDYSQCGKNFRLFC